MSRVLAALDARPAADGVLSGDAGTLDAATLRGRIDALAAALVALPPGPVASRLDNGPDAVVLELALKRLGRAHVALPPFFSDAQVAHALEAAVALVLPAAAAAGLPALPGGTLALRALPPPTRGVPAGTALLTYTSGSTGLPKGACLDAALPEAVAASLGEAMAPLGVRRHLCALPLGVLLETVGGIYAPLLQGGEIVLPGLAALGHGGSGGLDVARFIATLRAHQPDSLILVPQLLQALVVAAEQGAALPASLRMIAVGGARVPASLLARASALGLPVFEGYGLSECASVVCLNRPGAARAGSVGRVLGHTALRADADGELLVDGPRFLGYAGEPAPAAGPLRTGDLGRIDDEGFAYVEGRRKAMYITAWGRNVSPEWIEAELAQHPAIAQAVAWGEGLARAAAIVVPRRPDLAPAALERAVAEVNAGLPDYARIGHVLRADVPFSAANGLLTGNGRVRRDAVLARHADALAAAARADAREAPRPDAA